ncbi:hypothetical protein LPJ56_005318, partial [Coemansia sp. RSA 2599]
DVSDDGTMRRDIDKDKAIEELRMRVRASHERLPQSTGSASARERSRSATRSTQAAPPANTTANRPVAAQQQQQQDVLAISHDGAASVDGAGINIDDLEEGEHIEIETEKPMAPNIANGSIEPPTPSRSRTRAYYGSPSAHEQEPRRSSSYRDHAAVGSDVPYRKKYEEPPDRRDYRSREAYSGRSSSRAAAYHSRYAEAGGASYSSSRYPGARSPNPGDDASGGYRSERRQYSGRYDRYYSGGTEARSDAEYRQQYSPSS